MQGYVVVDIPENCINCRYKYVVDDEEYCIFTLTLVRIGKARNFGKKMSSCPLHPFPEYYKCYVDDPYAQGNTDGFNDYIDWFKGGVVA